MKRAIGMLVMVGIVLAVPACSSEQNLEQQSTQKSEQKIEFVSSGNVAEGRKAFIDLGCVRCHGVLGDGTLPAPVPGAAPILGGLNAEHTTEELSQAMAAPSHSIAPGFDAKTDGSSGMEDLTRKMTVRQLIDIVAYLKEAEKTDAIWPHEPSRR